MDTPSSLMRELSRRLLVASQSVSGTPVHEAQLVSEKLRVPLTRFAGAEGFASLLGRALVLASAEVPSLQSIKVSAQGRLEGFDQGEPAIKMLPYHGSRLPVLVNFAALKNAQGEITGAVTSFIDITERSRLEQQTHEQAEALAELHQRKDEFLAMLSHELRNPLSAITNALHVLRLEESGNPIQQRAKRIIERQVGQLAHLVDDLLEVSRVITGGIQLHQQELEMRGIVDRAVESARPLIDRRKHELSVSLPGEPIWLQGDPTRLEQVVVNLLNNAAKYTDEGGRIQLTVDQAGGVVVLRVSDTGVGIAPELLPRIFDLFTQADRTLDRSLGGLGIGLSLVEKLVKLHGGNVEARSRGLGQGSEFIVRLPALFPGSESLAPIPTVTQSEQTSRVLVVDDNIDAAEMLVMVLEMFGHQAQAAYSGREAIESIAEYQPNFVLLDIGLPDMNGYEVARHLRQQPETKNVILVAITGYGQDSDRQLSQDAGFDHHLVKPVEPQKLQDLLATLAKPSRSADNDSESEGNSANN